MLLSYFKDDGINLLTKITNGSWAFWMGELAEVAENGISKFFYCWDQAMQIVRDTRLRRPEWALPLHPAKGRSALWTPFFSGAAELFPCLLAGDKQVPACL